MIFPILILSLVELAFAQLGYDRYSSDITPKGGDKLFKGTTHNITWDMSDNNTVVDIRLFHGGGKNSDWEPFSSDSYELTENYDNNGYFEWTVPTDLPSSYAYRVKISGDYAGQDDLWSRYFTILNDGETLNECDIVEYAQPSTSLGRFIHPLSPEMVVVDESTDLVWVPMSNISRVTFFLRFESTFYSPGVYGKPHIVIIAKNIPNNGKYIWNVSPDLLSYQQGTGNFYTIALIDAEVDPDRFDELMSSWAINRMLDPIMDPESAAYARGEHPEPGEYGHYDIMKGYVPGKNSTNSTNSLDESSAYSTVFEQSLPLTTSAPSSTSAAPAFSTGNSLLPNETTASSEHAYPMSIQESKTLLSTQSTANPELTATSSSKSTQSSAAGSVNGASNIKAASIAAFIAAFAYFA